MLRSAFAATLVVGAVSAGHAQAPPTPPDHYALTNVRIVTAPGRVIERGTIVVRDGRIAAVGPQVTIPAAAIRLDLAGRTVYPGLIDAASSVGLPSLRQTGGPGGFGGGGGGFGGGAASTGDEVRPAREAADVWEPTDEELAAVRAAGVTTLGLVFDGGIFPGRVAVVNAGGTASARVLRPGIAQQVLLGRRRGGYPGTLMASLAYVQQSFFDAQHGMRARQAWERQPSGPLPDYNAELRALEPAASGALPVWFMASAERDLDRIVDLAAELGVRNYTIVGAQEGWRTLDVLRRANRPLIVSVDFPSATAITGRAYELHVAPPNGRDDGKARADSAAALQARGNPAALVRAGLQVALSSHGMSGPGQLRDRVRAAIAAGLSQDDALRALTITPARILGIESIAGTIETGRLANLVVVENGGLFDENARVSDVFVQGVRYEIPQQQPRGQQNGNQRGQRAVVMTGEWVGEMDSPMGLIQFVLTLAGTGEQITGRWTSELGAVDLTGTQSGGEVALTGTWAPPGMTALAFNINARVTGDDMRGTATAQGIAPVEFTARRRSPAGPNLEAWR